MNTSHRCQDSALPLFLQESHIPVVIPVQNCSNFYFTKTFIDLEKINFMNFASLLGSDSADLID